MVANESWRQSLVFLGEPLVELAPADNNLLHQGFAGDVLNTAVAVAQLGGNTYLASAVGNDPFSQSLMAFCHTNGVGTALVYRDEQHPMGLYVIRNDADGERHFTYWRSNSAAKSLLASEQRLCALLSKIANVGHFYVSGISLALMSAGSREVFFRWVADYRNAGGRVVYDSNYRAALWSSCDEYRLADQRMLTLTDVFLPSLDDVMQAYSHANSSDALEWIRRCDVQEVIVKNGIQPVTVLQGGREYEIEVPAVVPRDTTGAGDGFNGGYLAARLMGCDVPQAVRAGIWLSTKVVLEAGAILQPQHWQAAKLEFETLLSDSKNSLNEVDG